MRGKLMSAAERRRFIAKCERRGRCIEWTAYRNPDGYGKVTLRSAGGLWSAHRAAFADAFGPIPAGMLVRHTCDNPACIRRSHLLLGTDADNNADRARRLRSALKLSAVDVLSIRAASGTCRVIGERFGVSASAVCLIKSKLRRRYVEDAL
jgi:hypothetical protein